MLLDYVKNLKDNNKTPRSLKCPRCNLKNRTPLGKFCVHCHYNFDVSYTKFNLKDRNIRIISGRSVF
jgi:hypothetical protein